MFANIDPLELESDKDLYGRLDRSILDVETFGYDKNQVDS